MRTREALAEIVPTLKANGIRYRAIEIEHLGEKQVVQDLYALTRAPPPRRPHRLALAPARPWLALPLEKLLEISSDRTKTIWERIKDDLFLADFTRILAPAVANRERAKERGRRLARPRRPRLRRRQDRAGGRRALPRRARKPRRAGPSPTSRASTRRWSASTRSPTSTPPTTTSRS